MYWTLLLALLFSSSGGKYALVYGGEKTPLRYSGYS